MSKMRLSRSVVVPQPLSRPQILNVNLFLQEILLGLHKPKTIQQFVEYPLAMNLYCFHPPAALLSHQSSINKHLFIEYHILCAWLQQKWLRRPYPPNWHSSVDSRLHSGAQSSDALYQSAKLYAPKTHTQKTLPNN